ncbi:hypothetical protein, partial [Alistipes sp.]|uniref:hypothetical protein n=1 Tax=Alistipes sp. TaxID=1872444 RepID=UPI0023F24799
NSDIISCLQFPVNTFFIFFSKIHPAGWHILNIIKKIRYPETPTTGNPPHIKPYRRVFFRPKTPKYSKHIEFYFRFYKNILTRIQQ